MTEHERFLGDLVQHQVRGIFERYQGGRGAFIESSKTLTLLQLAVFPESRIFKGVSVGKVRVLDIMKQ